MHFNVKLKEARNYQLFIILLMYRIKYGSNGTFFQLQEQTVVLYFALS
jgi:hypothetical protein